MTIFLYTIMFMIGATIGSFCTLAVYRIPLKKDISHERSFCPNCNHKLQFFDLIPILSYIFLGGKCRYCKKKIRIRYLLLELFAGCISLLVFSSFNFSLEKIEVLKYIAFFINLLYITGITIIAGIDKEMKTTEKSVLIYNTIITIIYILYLFIVGETSVNRYAIYLFFMFVFFMIKILDTKNKQSRKQPVIFYISIANIVLIIIQNYMYYR